MKTFEVYYETKDLETQIVTPQDVEEIEAKSEEDVQDIIINEYATEDTGVRIRNVKEI
jgi:hypothetical protein